MNALSAKSHHTKQALPWNEHVTTGGEQCVLDSTRPIFSSRHFATKKGPKGTSAYKCVDRSAGAKRRVRSPWILKVVIRHILRVDLTVWKVQPYVSLTTRRHGVIYFPNRKWGICCCLIGREISKHFSSRIDMSLMRRLASNDSGSFSSWYSNLQNRDRNKRYCNGKFVLRHWGILTREVEFCRTRDQIF